MIWRHDQVPSYQLAVVVDDAAMQITEVVRGEDLLISTARQLLIYRALGLKAPSFYHCELMKDTKAFGWPNVTMASVCVNCDKTVYRPKASA